MARPVTTIILSIIAAIVIIGIVGGVLWSAL